MNGAITIMEQLKERVEMSLTWLNFDAELESWGYGKTKHNEVV